jgi:excisionase family DNA binding protein
VDTIPKMLTVKEASTVSRLAKSTIYKLLDEGILHRLRLPGCNKVLIAEEELKRYIQEGIQAGLSPMSA